MAPGARIRPKMPQTGLKITFWGLGICTKKNIVLFFYSRFFQTSLIFQRYMCQYTLDFHKYSTRNPQILLHNLYDCIVKYVKSIFLGGADGAVLIKTFAPRFSVQTLFIALGSGQFASI